MPVPVRYSPVQKRILAAQTQSSLSQHCHSEASFASSFAAASQFELSQRDFSPPRPVTLPSSEPRATVSALLNKPEPVRSYSPLVSAFSAAAAAGVVVRPAATSLTNLSLSTSSTSSSSTERPRLEAARQPVTISTLPSPPPFVSKHRNRQRPSPTHGSSQGPVSYEASFQSQQPRQLDVSTSQDSSTSTSRPLVSATQPIEEEFEQETMYGVASQQPFKQSASAQPLQPRLPAQADGGYRQSHNAQRQTVAGLQTDLHDDKQFSSHQSPYPMPYPPFFPPFYPPASAMQQPYSYITPPASQPGKHRRRPASLASSDSSSSVASSSDDNIAADHNSSQRITNPARSSAYRQRNKNKAQRHAAVEYKSIYREHKQLLSTPQQPHMTTAIKRALTKPQLLRVIQSREPFASIYISEKAADCLTHCRVCLLYGMQIFAAHRQHQKKDTSKAELVAILVQWIDSGKVKKPAQLAAGETAQPKKKKQCTRTEISSATARSTVGVKEPRAELNQHQSTTDTPNYRPSVAPHPTPATSSIHSPGSSGDNRSSDSDFNPTQSKAEAAGRRKKTASAEDDTASSSGQDGDKDSVTSPPKPPTLHAKKTKANTSAPAISAPTVGLPIPHLSAAGSVEARIRHAAASSAASSPTGIFQRLPAGYLPPFELVTDGGVVLCVAGAATYIHQPQHRSAMSPTILILLVCVGASLC